MQKSFLNKKENQQTRLVTQFSEHSKPIIGDLKRYRNKEPSILNKNYKTNLLSLISQWKNQTQNNKVQQIQHIFQQQENDQIVKHSPMINFKPIYKHEVDRMNQDISVNQYTLSKILGKGAQGIVKLGTDTKKLYAVKIINCQKLKKKFFIKKQELEQMISVQVNILKTLNHPNIIKLYEALYSQEYQKLFLILEYCGKGTIINLINSKDIEQNQWSTLLKKFCSEMAHALDCLYENNIVHRDIKAQNILVTENNTFKLCDFNVSNTIRKNQLQSSNNFVGTKLYASPEILIRKKDTKYDPFGLDIWSLGITLYQFKLRKHPFVSKSLQELQQIIQSKIVIPETFEPGFKDLLQKMLQLDFKKRIKIKSILNHEWIKGY